MAHDEKRQDPNKMLADNVTLSTEPMRVSLGNPYDPKVKTTGIVQRGAGKATKGKTMRGPTA